MQSWKSRLMIGVAASVVAAAATLTIGPARAQVINFLSCATTTPCLEWDNTATGDAIKGVGAKGVGIHGQTKFKSLNKPAGTSGVFGEDISTSGNQNSGVRGVSTNGTGVTGSSTGLNGVAGFSSAAGASGVYGQNSAPSGLGIAGRNTSSSTDLNGAGVLADGGPANDAIHAFANNSHDAVYAFSQTGTSFHAVNGSSDLSPELFLKDSSTAGGDAIDVQASTGEDVFTVSNVGTTNVAGHLFVASDDNDFVGTPRSTNSVLNIIAGVNSNVVMFSLFNSDATDEMDVTSAGNIIIKGLLFSSGSCHVGCLIGQKQVQSVTEYSPVETEPTIEDSGEAMLVGGVANVALDPKFANVIDTSVQYLVSVTPEGDCRGLYVSNRTPTGFIVRELQGGRSNVSFEYRISAKRFGVQAQRLPMTAIHRAAPFRKHP